LKTSVSAGHSALQNAGREKKKKDKALVDFVLIIDIKNDTCDKVEDFAAI